MTNEISAVIDFLEEARNKFNIPKEKLEENGQIFYANGNDGTDFDWEVNDRLCEFGYSVKNRGIWAFKLLVNSNGRAEIYCYPNGESRPVEVLRKVLMTDDEVRDLYLYMYEIADARKKWNKTLKELGAVE